MCYVAQNAVPKAMTIAEIQEASEKDKTICKIRECIEKNKWTKEGELKPYFIVRKDLTVHESIILKGRKLVIPRKLRQRILQLAHESHQGVLKTKQLLREKVWWPRMDKDLEEMIKTCHACQIMANPTQAPPVNTTKLPDRPWKKLGIDLTGPFTNNEYLLVVIDYYSRFPEVEIVRSITSATIINKLRKIFAVHGICNELVSDNGSQFVSEEFKSYLEELGIKHTRVTPYWARTNGLVENFNKSLKKAIREARAENKNWHNELYTFLLQYRNTPHLTTGRTPAELLFNTTVMTKSARNVKIQSTKFVKKQRQRAETKNEILCRQKNEQRLSKISNRTKCYFIAKRRE